MPRLLIFNVDHEEHLAGRTLRLKPAVARKLAARFLFLGAKEDVLEGDFELPLAFRARFPDLPRVAADGDSARHAGSPGVGAAGDDTPRTSFEWAPSEPREVVRRVSSKAFAHELARRLGLEPPGVLCHSVSEVAANLPEGRWVVKRAFGHGALGHFLGAGRALPPNAPGWLEKALAPGEPVVLEPWVEREADYSVQLEVGDRVRVLAALELLATPQGAYLGNRVGTVPREIERALVETARRVGEALGAEGYRGPAGIDAYVSQGKLRPLVEVNARHTMGRIALALSERLAKPVASWLTLPGPLAVEAEGEHHVVTDPFPHEAGPSSVFVWARSRDELLARERALSTAGSQ